MAIAKSQIVVHEGVVDARGFTDQNSLANALISAPDQLTPIITFLMGDWSNNFPLLSLTEGQAGGTDNSVPLNSIEYTYPVMGKRKTAEAVISSQYATSDKPGLNYSSFFVVFPKFFAVQNTIRNQAGQLARIMSEPVPVGSGGYRYELQLFTNTPTDYCDTSTLVPGSIWGHLPAAAVGESMSTGNWSTVQTPGKQKNQISILRKSYRLAGNISQKTVEFQLFDTNGKPSNLWIDYEEFQHMLAWREAKELHLWTSILNRDSLGQIHLIDPATGQPIPTGAGVMQQIPNSATYTTLTDTLMNNTVGDVFNNAADKGKMDIILYTGTGGMREFDNMAKASNMFKLVAQSAGGQFVKSNGGYLQLGGYFNSFVTQDGHTVTVKALPFLNHGAYAESSGVHPVTGLPLSSYEMYFLDQSSYNGQRNVKLMHQKGRMEIRGLEQGMSLVKGSNYGDYNGNGRYLQLASEVDATSIHFLATTGVQIMRNTHCFKLLPGVK